jgi:hypothetical protein
MIASQLRTPVPSTIPLSSHSRCITKGRRARNSLAVSQRLWFLFLDSETAVTVCPVSSPLPYMPFIHCAVISHNLSHPSSRDQGSLSFCLTVVEDVNSMPSGIVLPVLLGLKSLLILLQLFPGMISMPFQKKSHGLNKFSRPPPIRQIRWKPSLDMLIGWFNLEMPWHR